MITLTDKEHLEGFMNALKERLQWEHTHWGEVNEKYTSNREDRFLTKIYGFWKVWKEKKVDTLPWLAIASLCMQEWLKEKLNEEQHNE